MDEVFMICWRDRGIEGRVNTGKPFCACVEDATEAVAELNEEWPDIKHWLTKQKTSHVDDAEDEVRRSPDHNV